MWERIPQILPTPRSFAYAARHFIYEGEVAMDHDVVVRDKMTEKYLLEELVPELRDEFEEHFFDCPECARDVRAVSEFVEHSKAILAEQRETVSIAATESTGLKRVERDWFAWLRPALAAPAFAILLAVVGYQNLVTLPRLTQAVNKPQLLPAATVNLLTYGGNAPPLMIHNGEGFLLNVIVPPGNHFVTYRVELYNPAGAVAESVLVSASTDDTWPIRFATGDWQSGSYKLAVHGINASGQDVEIGKGLLELQVQK
jgi:hypothetical protein